MRFECKVRVVNRNPGAKSCSSYIKSTIALGKETYTDNDYFMLHFSNIVRGSLKGSRYTKYRLKQNPTKVFTKCINEGKITISFEDPMHDLFIQGEALQLSRFVGLLNSCLAGEVDVLPTTITVEAKERYNKHQDEKKQDKKEIKKVKAKKQKKNSICSKQEIVSTAEAHEERQGVFEDKEAEMVKSVLDKNDTNGSKQEKTLAVEDEETYTEHVNEKEQDLDGEKVDEQTFLLSEKVICRNHLEQIPSTESTNIQENVNEEKQGLTEDSNVEEEISVNTVNTNYRKKRKRIRYRRLELWFSDSLRLTT